MILLTVDEVVVLQSRMIDETGGLHGLRDSGLLESALFSAVATYEEIERYASVEEKAARLAYALINNHAFVDGNKRTGIYVMLLTLDVNNIQIKYTQLELIELGFGVAAGRFDYEDALQWILQHKESGSTDVR